MAFGRIRVLDADKQYEHHPFSSDPLDHSLEPDPVFTLELRRFEKPGGAVVYKTHIAPANDKDGSFFWILPAGDYVLASNPCTYGSERFDPGETRALAGFRIPASGGAIYLGTLVISIHVNPSLQVVGEMCDTEYDIRDLQVLDDRESAIQALRDRFRAVPEPLAPRLMTPERD